MKIHKLYPAPLGVESFRWSRLRYVPEESGCYALTTFENDILYVGLASSLRRRMGEHLDNPQKTVPTMEGKAVWFYWFCCRELEKVERTWMNIYALEHGRLPVLNRAYSPTAI